MTSGAYAADGYTPDPGGIYFLDNNEIYKGTKRFGANKVTAQATPPTAAAGAIAGDINIYNGKAEVFNGSEWTTIVNDSEGLNLKASVGTSYVADAGVNVSIELTSTTAPSLTVVVSAIENAAGITDNAENVVAGKAVYALTNGLISTTYAATDDTYIKGITQDPTTKVLTAETGTFSTDVQNAIGFSTMDGSANGVTVSVDTEHGVVTSVVVDASNLTPETFMLQSTNQVIVD